MILIDNKCYKKIGQNEDRKIIRNLHSAELTAERTSE